MRGLVRGALTFAAAMCVCLQAHGVPLSAQEVGAACAGADGLAHCGRLVEAIQLKRFPNLARREGNVLNVTLYPAGQTTFIDTNDDRGARSYNLWDYLDAPNIAVIYATRGDDATFLLLQRTNGRVFEVPAEPRTSPDLSRLATADVCAHHCSGEIAVWKVTPEGVRKEASWAPAEQWVDASVHWKSADTLEIEYTTGKGGAGRTIERRLDQRDWKRVPER